MKNLIITLISLFVSIPAFAQEKIQGYDVLGVARYCDQFLKAPQLPAMSVLLNTFGNPLPCIEKRIAKGGLRAVQVDLIDATCWRNNKCPKGAAQPTDLKEITRRAQTVNKLAVKYPNIEWWVSPALEHDVKNEQTVIKMLEAVTKGCKTCKPINSPYSGVKTKKYPLELHNTKVSAFSVSSDGSSAFDGDNLPRSVDNSDFEHRIAGSYTTYLWINELNLRCSGEKNFVPPLSRTNRPTSDLFNQLYQLSKPSDRMPPPPSVCKQTTSFKRGEIYKTNAEAYCNGQVEQGDKRGNKPLLILQKGGKRGDKLKVLNPDGREVASFCYYGAFEGNTHRWYMGNCSGQSSYQLYTQMGNREWAFVQLENGVCLPINVIRRMGTYR